MYNLAVARGGYVITTIIASSASVQAAQLPPGAYPEHAGPHIPREDCCYPSEARVFVCDHLKFLTGMGRNTGGVASNNVMAVCKALKHYFDAAGAGVMEAPTAVSVYGAVQASPYFQPRLVPAEAFTSKKHFNKAVKAMASGLAQINGTSCSCGREALWAFMSRPSPCLSYFLRAAVQCTHMDCLYAGSKTTG